MPELQSQFIPISLTCAQDLALQFTLVRKHTEAICQGLQAEDYVPQPIPDVSPPKWHLAHTTWFFETFILKEFKEEYRVFDDQYAYLFNSYYEAAGPRILRTQRGNLTRPSTAEVYTYRSAVDQAIVDLLKSQGEDEALQELVILGLQHEQQHQELLITDILYILGHNPLFPSFASSDGIFSNARLNVPLNRSTQNNWMKFPADIYHIGYEGEDFCFDNERNRHRVFTESFEIQRQVVTCGEYLDFINDKGYERVDLWLSEGWAFAKTLDQHAPMHWHWDKDQWYQYTPGGLVGLSLDSPVTHISFYEADAFARWAGARLATEFEWEIAHQQLDWGQVWEWTNSAYLPYPGFQTAPGALGEYNGKWMINQMVLRGSSVATSPAHSRPTYRNFFHPDKRWQYSGIRLARSL